MQQICAVCVVHRADELLGGELSPTQQLGVFLIRQSMQPRDFFFWGCGASSCSPPMDGGDSDN
jgi:hypothetical protein